MPSNCGDQNLLPPGFAEQIRGPETRAVVVVLSKGFSLLAGMLRFVADTLTNLRIIADAGPYTFSKLSTSEDVTPGTPLLIFANKTNSFVAVYVSAETYGSGTEGLLMLDTEKDQCTSARARFKKYGTFPSTTCLVAPNARLYADISDSSGGQQTTFKVTATAANLSGTGPFLGTGPT